MKLQIMDVELNKLHRVLIKKKRISTSVLIKIVGTLSSSVGNVDSFVIPHFL